MSLRGNLNSVDLANIFQMLSINQKEGTLNIFDGDSKRSIYFSNQGVSMLSRGKGKKDSLGRILLRYDRISEAQLEIALEKQRHSGRLLGTVLVESGFIPQEVVEDATRIQIEEEIYNLFIWKDASFEFIEGAPPREFEEIDGGITRLTFNVNSLIMEAARRIDEWDDIRKAIPATGEIFRYSGKNMELTDDIFREPYCEKVLANLNGKCSVEEIIDRSFVNKFEVCKILFLLLEQGAIEPVPAEDLLQNAEAAVGRGEVRDGIKFLERIVALGADTPETHQMLGEAYEALDEIREAAEHYRVHAEHRLGAGEADEAFRIYGKICELIPTALQSPERLIEVFVEHAEELSEHTDEVIDRGKDLATIFLELKKMKQAVQTLHRIIALAPEDFSLRNLLINIYLANNMSSEAIAEYEAMATYYSKRRDWDQVIKMLRKILVIDRNRADVSQRLEQLIAKKEKKKQGVKRLVLIFIVVIGLGVLGYGYVDYELKARETIRDANEEAGRTIAAQNEVMDPAIEELRGVREAVWDEKRTVGTDRLVSSYRKVNDLRTEYQRAIEEAVLRLQDVANQYRYSTARKQAEQKQEALAAKLAEVDEVLEFARDEVQKRAIAMAASAERLLLEKGECTEAYELYSRAWDVAPDKAELSELEVDRRVENLGRSLREIGEGLGRVEGLRKEGRHEEARDLALQVVETYTVAEVLREMPLPIRVESLPPGAEIRVNGVETGVRTPGWVAWRPGVRTTITMHLPGFEVESFVVPAVESQFRKQEMARIRKFDRLHRELSKEILWSASLDGAIEGEPVVDGGQVYLVTRNSVVFRLDPEQRQSEILYDAKSLSLSGFSSSPVVADGSIYLAMVEGNLQRVSLATKRPVWSRRLEDQVYAPLVLANGTLLVGDLSGRLTAWNAEDGSLRWEHRLPGEIRSRFVVHEGKVYVATTTGHLMVYGIGDASPRLHSIVPGGDRPAALAAPLIVDGRLHVGSSDGNFYVFDLTTMKEVWRYFVGAEIRSRPVWMDGAVLVAAADGRIHALAEGKRLDVLPVGGSMPSPPRRDGDRILAVNDAGRIVRAVFRDGKFETRWRFDVSRDAETRVRVPPVTVGDRVLIATESGRVLMLRE